MHFGTQPENPLISWDFLVQKIWSSKRVTPSISLAPHHAYAIVHDVGLLGVGGDKLVSSPHSSSCPSLHAPLHASIDPVTPLVPTTNILQSSADSPRHVVRPSPAAAPLHASTAKVSHRPPLFGSCSVEWPGRQCFGAPPSPPISTPLYKQCCLQCKIMFCMAICMICWPQPKCQS